jgi:hypothetical protein
MLRPMSIEPIEVGRNKACGKFDTAVVDGLQRKPKALPERSECRAGHLRQKLQHRVVTCLAISGRGIVNLLPIDMINWQEGT